MFGNLGELPSDVPVLLAWGRESVVEVAVAGQKPARTANVLYYVPVPMTVRGETTFAPTLMRSTVLSADAGFFDKNPQFMNFGKGQVTMSYRPIPFNGTLETSKVLVSMSFGDGAIGAGGKPIAPIPPPVPDPSAEPVCIDEPCPGGQFDGLPEVDVFRLSDATWQRLPHFTAGVTYELKDPGAYVDPSTGTIQFRFVNDRQDSVGMSFAVTLQGNVR
jgi:hypothetical protein